MEPEMSERKEFLATSPDEIALIKKTNVVK